VSRPGVVKAAISRQWKRRKEALDRIQPVVVAGSGWLMRQAAMSTITGAFERRLILMGIDEKVYAPGDKHALRARFGLPPDAIVLYVGAQNLGDPRKGFRYLDAALRQLEEMLDVSERTKVVLFTVGKLDPQLQGSLPLAHVHSAYITDPRLFAATYAAADLFICPSVEDSGPMMINESIMSGTPVAAFEMGVAVDLVETGVTGYRVPLADSRALAAALASFVRLPPAERAAMSTACRAVGLEKSSSSRQVRAFVDLAAQMQGSPKHMIAG
jgi:glycosyltransferase involved in cell wall biosynthesis